MRAATKKATEKAKKRNNKTFPSRLDSAEQVALIPAVLSAERTGYRQIGSVVAGPSPAATTSTSYLEARRP